MYKILITDPLSEHGIQQLLDAPDVEVVRQTNLSPTDLLSVIGDYDALLVRSQTQVTAEVLAAGKKLKVVGRAGVGVDNIDINAATEAGVVVINAPDGNTISTAEHSFAMLMAVARNIPQAHKKLTDGTWDRKSFQGVELNNKVLGIIGLGRIGTEVAKRAKAFGMTVLAYDPFLTEERAKKLGVTHATIDDICRQADFITVHTPLTKETRHIISSREFMKMKDGVRIINCARGGIIDEKALYEAILTGKVAGAALDVFEIEPPVDNPLIGLPQVVVTPHLGASTQEAQENVAVDVSAEILKVLRGEPFKNAVNLPSIPAHVMERLQPYFTLGEKLGNFLAQVTVGSIQEIAITYSGELADVDTAPLTRTVLRGVLSFRLGEEVNYVNAPLLAKVRDITVTEKKSAHNRGFTNLLTVTLKTTQQTRTVAGTRLNGYGARIVKIDDFAIDVAPEGYLLYIHHNDRPGVIGRVGSILGNNDVNIATMQVGRRDIGGDAIMMLSVDKPVSAELLDSMGELPEVKSVTQIEL
ncbi:MULTISPECIES: phosphoglycerate dehydrogenase [Bacillales]|jgi:D-3-phosphoglycerate dehydrogenase|uniref:D-3-phosphoglycerate dehydrogenase n=1 Tax=Brevibacillus aydinogluensis TaxID=927786 RepID=A0AA48RHS1_9BACL|nr:MULTISPECIES: phosphoglycerate dehydrogenase [Bacillales]REK62271.1 MAG: phosphoglycerate dehydrogenase [Brevibacillus sp.]MDT3415327.1 D-3-phosphoglycerate dehydrogenase [Brevibacillus aydinogluensis]NNV02659.1 phosphoglycerate dehydrogenase [Brevibacillus sp. MCWH]UFJ60417.1 phosphoglycerate dehydrogenase [Anoxybacillus sediminis]CAJ1002894.1 phosphoglycerate dehydrogenase [Brevibacillus aydinogluensis]